MIVADSSVWIRYLNDQTTAQTEKLDALLGREEVLVGDIILLELLQGARSEIHAAQIERELRTCTIEAMLWPELAVVGARNYRTLRGLGITVRKIADIVIGTFCIERGHVLLHDDRDFAPMEKHLGLKVL